MRKQNRDAWVKKKQKPNHKHNATGLTAEEKQKRFEKVTRPLED